MVVGGEEINSNYFPGAIRDISVKQHLNGLCGYWPIDCLSDDWLHFSIP